MIVLLSQPLIPILIGILLISWGLISLQLSLSQWAQVLINILFNNFTDQTKKERREFASTPADEVISNNAGCIFLLAGVASLGFGLVRIMLD